MPRIHASSILLFLLALLLGACTPEPEPEPEPSSAAPPAPSSKAPVTDTAANEVDRPLVIFLGDSLTAGFGLDPEQAFPALLERRLALEGRPIRALNAGVSGDTTAGGLRQLDWLLRQEPDVLVVALGGNDALRGLDPAQSEENLRQVLERAQERGVRVLLAGMRAPPNMGSEYSERFAALYSRLAEDYNVAFLPFLLAGVGGVAELNQADGIHPTAEGQRRLADLLLPPLRRLLDDL